MVVHPASASSHPNPPGSLPSPFESPPPAINSVYLARTAVALIGLALALYSVWTTPRREGATFVLLAAGRIDPQERIDTGRITWSGDAEWGERMARNLAYTM